MSPDAAIPIGGAIRQALKDARRRPLVVGLCGAQGSGKSTLAARLTFTLACEGVCAATLSIDDLYCTKAERERLGESVHPLLRTRGVPGTHDVDFGRAILAEIDAGRPTLLPRFDKARDDRAPIADWDRTPTRIDVFLLEGWCVGAAPQSDARLAEPLNALERDHDADGAWRRFVNAALSGDYQRLFARIDLLVLLAAPSFAVVRAWRTEQEHDLRARMPGGPGAMSDAQVARFVEHYERLTRHILAEMPARADLVVSLDADRLPVAISGPFANAEAIRA